MFLSECYKPWRHIISYKRMQKQKPILNFAPRGKLRTPGTKLPPRGEFCPLGVKLSNRGEILCSPLHSSKQ
jgi:hypothetical protein